MAFGKFFIPSVIGFNSLTRPSFKSFCMSVTGLKSFESSYCVLKSPTRSDKNFCWMFCLILRNSLTIKSLFFEHDFEHGFEHSFELGLEHEFESE